MNFHIYGEYFLWLKNVKRKGLTKMLFLRVYELTFSHFSCDSQSVGPSVSYGLNKLTKKIIREMLIDKIKLRNYDVYVKLLHPYL